MCEKIFVVAQQKSNSIFITYIKYCIMYKVWNTVYAYKGALINVK